MSDDKRSSGCGLGSVSTTLFVVFIVLKLVGVIDWPWLWVLSPLWIGLVVGLVIVGLVFLLKA
jgi:hypothetical protein